MEAGEGVAATAVDGGGAGAAGAAADAGVDAFSPVLAAGKGDAAGATATVPAAAVADVPHLMGARASEDVAGMADGVAAGAG